MPGERRDYLLHLISQAAVTIRRLREMLAQNGAPDEIVRDAAAAQAELLGADHLLLASLDPDTAATLITDADRIAHWAELLQIEAEAARRLGDPARASRLEQHATKLLARVDRAKRR